MCVILLLAGPPQGDAAGIREDGEWIEGAGDGSAEATAKGS